MPKETTIVASVNIPAPVEQVWASLCDSSRYAEWVENTLEVVRTDGPVRLGATYEEVTRISGPWKTETRWRVTEFEPPRRQVHEGEGVATARNLALVIELTPGDGVSHLTITVRYTPRFGLLGAFIDRAIQGAQTRSQQRSVEAFSALVISTPRD